MDDRADDELAAIAARWESPPPGDLLSPQAVAEARRDIAVLLGEIARLHLHLDVLTPPPRGTWTRSRYAARGCGATSSTRTM